MRSIQKKHVMILLFFLFCYGSAFAGQKVVVVQSVRVGPYEEAYKGIRSRFKSGIHRLVLSELEGSDIETRIKRMKPDVICAMGIDALAKTKTIKDLPIVFLMVLNSDALLSGESNITGVDMDVSQEKKLEIILKALPNTQNIGTLFDPKRTGHLIEKATAAAETLNLKLIAKKVHHSRDIPLEVSKLKGNIDVFWMLPDLTVVTPEAVEMLLLFSLENQIPIVTFSEKYLGLGAFMSISTDAFDMGAQAGLMAEKILSGKDVREISRAKARKAVISMNKKIADKLGIHVSEAFILSIDTD